MNNGQKAENKEQKVDNPLSKIADIILKVVDVLGRIVEPIAPKIPPYVGAAIILAVVAILFIFGFLGLCILAGLDLTIVLIFWGPLFIILLIVLVFIIVMGIRSRSDRRKVVSYPKEEVIGKNNIVLADKLGLDQKEGIRKVLREAAGVAAKVLNLNPDLVRSNLFGRDEHDRLRMIKDLTFQMNHPDELTLKIPIGYGSTGRCFKSSDPNIAVLENDWGRDRIEDSELRKLHPELKWIISMPVLGGGDPARPIWVLNVDGLREKRQADDLQKALRKIFKYSATISIILGQKH